MRRFVKDLTRGAIRLVVLEAAAALRNYTKSRGAGELDVSLSANTVKGRPAMSAALFSNELLLRGVGFLPIVLWRPAGR